MVSSSSPSSSDELIFTQDDARTLLLITVDGEEPQGFVAVRFDPANSRFRTMAIPRDTEVYEGATPYRLWELYKEKGIAGTETALETLMGIHFDNYASITYTGIERLVTYLGNGVYITLSENLEYTGEGYFINMEGGCLLYTSRFYPFFRVGGQQKCERLSPGPAVSIQKHRGQRRTHNRKEGITHGLYRNQGKGGRRADADLWPVFDGTGKGQRRCCFRQRGAYQMCIRDRCIQRNGGQHVRRS